MLCFVSFILGIILPAIPKQFIWLPIAIACKNKKKGIIGFFLGLALIFLHYREPIKPGTYLVPTSQITKKNQKQARLEIIRDQAPFLKGDIVIAKLTSNFYLQNSTCKLKCKNFNSNSNGWQPSSKWYYLSQNIVALCQEVQCSPAKQSNLQQAGRLFLEKKIPQSLKNIGVIRALLLGQAYLVPPEQKQLFKFAGLAHLIAVSGLHIGLIAGIFGIIMGLFWRVAIRITWKIPKAEFVNIGTCIGSIFYAWLSGFGDASCRAMSMILVANIARKIPMSLMGEQVLLIAVCSILLIKPLSVFSLGLWLSAIAVWALIKAGNNIIKSQINIFVIMLPIQAMMAWPLGWWMPLVNLITIPIFSFILVPGAFFAWLLSLISGTLSSPIWFVCDQTLTYLFQALSYLQKKVGFGYVIPVNSPWQILFLALMAFYLIRTKFIPATIAAILFLLLGEQKLGHGKFSAEILDVGQGLSVIIRTRNHTMLVDTGTFAMGQKVVLPVLRQYGLKHLDKIIISHGDFDHSGGLKALINNIKYNEIIAGEPKRLKVTSTPCDNRSWHWDGVIFSSYQVSSAKKHNNLSCIIHVQAIDKSILIPGDIESKIESKLIDMTLPGSMRADILIAPHHGSISSSSKQFIAAVKPKIIVVSAGDYSIYKHPAKQHVKYWQKQHIQYFNTHFDGSIKL